MNDNFYKQLIEVNAVFEKLIGLRGGVFIEKVLGKNYINEK